MTLPPQVQREADALAQLEQTFYAPQVEPPAPPAEPAPELTAPEPAPEVPAPAPIEPPAPPVPPAVDWEQKYRSLQGVFNSQVPALQGQVKALQDQMEAIKAKTPEPAPKPDADPKDAEVFGADVVDMVVRTAKGLLVPQVASLQSRVAKLEQLADSLMQTSTVTAEEVFFRAVDAEVPDWEAINRDQRFLDWLAEVDPVYRQPRGAALTQARQALDARAVVAIFKVFKQQTEPPKPAAPAAPRPSLQQQVSPGSTTASVTPTAPSAKPLVTQREIEVFYNELAQGKWRGREQQAAAREAEINQALAEGRVR